mmetsp:Transcript_29204/g.92268  ORF Transcript_29204/g.92268 Transcript_29204/m.92268 type:complete len:290 (-) Transcript_29204:16-885(-)
MGEALVPVELAQQMALALERDDGCAAVELAAMGSGTVEQPWGASENHRAFAEWKRAKNRAVPRGDPAAAQIDAESGCQRDASFWLDLFQGLGFTHAVFGNPSACPWGGNWGNLVLLKERPASATVLQLPGAQDKRFFFGSSADENRTLVEVELQDGTVFFATHLEDRDASLRRAQVKRIAERVNVVKASAETVILVGDLNEVYLPAYSEHERRVLETFNYNAAPLPHEALQYLTDSAFDGAAPATRGLKHESVFNKNVCHWLLRGGAATATAVPFYTDIGDHTLTVLVQ